MRAQIITLLLVAIFCCEATNLPGGYSVGGANYGAPGPLLNAIPPYGTYAPPGAAYYPAGTYAPPSAAYNPAGAYAVPPGYGGYVVVSDGSAYGANYAVPGPGYAVSPKTAGYASPLSYGYGSNLGAYGNIVYLLKK